MQILNQKTILKTPKISRKGQPGKADPADTLFAFPTIARVRVYNLVTANADEILSLATSLTASLTLPEYIAEVMP